MRVSSSPGQRRVLSLLCDPLPSCSNYWDKTRDVAVSQNVDRQVNLLGQGTDAVLSKAVKLARVEQYRTENGRSVRKSAVNAR